MEPLSEKNKKLQLDQLIFPPFRTETNIPRNELPIYSAETPHMPPFSPYRPIKPFPTYPSYQQITEILQKKTKGD